MKKLRIVGVPEHFNLPWHLAIEDGVFADAGIDVSWTDVPEGTGRMCNMLEQGETDLAVILTEGITKSITEGNPSRIIQEYVASPLLWGIHVAARSEHKTVESLQGTRAAISRFGSGSHLMSYVLAQQEGWDTTNLAFEVVNDLDGAIDALSTGRADYFMWERFTTQPLVDGGVFRRLGDCPTPWPCFVIAARLEFIQNQAAAIRLVLDIINRYTIDFSNIPSIDRTLANAYGQKLEDIQTWLELTRWSQEQLDSQVIEKVIITLHNLKLIDKQIGVDHILTIV